MKTTNALHNGFQQLGFDNELGDCLFLCENLNEINDLNIKFHLEIAKEFNATAVFFRKELNNYKPQIYIYDYTGNIFEENNLTNIHKKVWSSGNVPLVCAFYDTEIKIIDCTTHIKDNKPTYLVKDLSLILNAHKIYNEQFAIKIKTGSFWEEKDNKNKFKFNNSAYDILIKWIKELKKEYVPLLKIEEKAIINKVIVQSILIKYLEERQDENGKRLFHNKYFNEFEKAKKFTDVLRNTNNFISLLEKLHKDFNGNLFEWDEDEKEILKNINLSLLADALSGYANPNNKDQIAFELIRYYEFSYVPVELISRLYEEFLGENKQENGLFYTPSHLAKLLVDEAMPLKDYDKINLTDYKMLDPACGSGIFLVLGFKRLVQWWRLQNELKRPNSKELKKLISCIYGIDKEQQATKLAAFSLCLALCDELSPMQIISELRFDDLTQTNILFTDFFIDEFDDSFKEIDLTFEIQKKNHQKINDIKFNLVIGNPPFGRSGDISNVKKDFWKVKFNDKIINIPSKQIALKFLSKSLQNLTPNGLQCLIIKSSGLLYNPTSNEYKKLLFSDFNTVQILDFTALARNKAMWDNGADVDTIAVFTKNQVPVPQNNILHLTFKRTKTTKERIVFDIDEYDLNFVSRVDAVNNPFIWKINLIGGGRIKGLIDKLNTFENLEQYLNTNGFLSFEGEGGGKSLDNLAFETSHINDEFVTDKYLSSFKSLNNKKFNPPNILIKENISIPFSLNKKNIPYSNEIVGIYSENIKDLDFLKSYLSLNLKYLQFYILATSSKALIYKNTAILKADIMRLPYFKGNIGDTLSQFDEQIISNVINYYQDFLRHGEGSKILKQIDKIEIKNIILNYGIEFSKILNLIYENENKKFRLSDVVQLFNNSYTAVVFKYDNSNEKTKFHIDNSKLNLESLTTQNISKHLNSTRTIKIYDNDDTIIFIKPNQYRYWLSLIAYRDADKSFADLTKAGY
ncbi:Eco57I restriction-modification methylase domain-containing protein [Flavobacterium psychrophilum]|uniref:Eco57I restriction-modification methylase domain-containing protein n=1 Tax=Flavobacterium psychrophilum TaxID=96345 RepID=UPI00106DB034|nr:DNA methyltransferase [Flavobacterium psychrophilum]